ITYQLELQDCYRYAWGADGTSPSYFGISFFPDCLSSFPDTSGGTKCGTPGVSINVFTDIRNKGMLYEPASTFQFSDVVTKLVGRHSIKIGGDLRRYSIDNYQPNYAVGEFFFNGAQTGDAFVDFLLGGMRGKQSVRVQT